MQAIERLSLHPLIDNKQPSWVKLGQSGALSCLNSGVNDMGGTLMNESISKAAGSIHGQEFTPDRMESFILSANRTPLLRDTLYNKIDKNRMIHQSAISSSMNMQMLLESAYPST